MDNILKERIKTFLQTLGVQTTKFADNVGIGRSTLYMWRKGEIKISERLMQKIDDYLKMYGF